MFLTSPSAKVSSLSSFPLSVGVIKMAEVAAAVRRPLVRVVRGDDKFSRERRQKNRYLCLPVCLLAPPLKAAQPARRGGPTGFGPEVLLIMSNSQVLNLTS